MSLRTVVSELYVDLLLDDWAVNERYNFSSFSSSEFLLIELESGFSGNFGGGYGTNLFIGGYITGFNKLSFEKAFIYFSVNG